MRKVLTAIALILLFAATSYAQYNIYLKNGSVLRGIREYKEVNGELRFMYMGGTVGIPADNVLRIEEAGGRPGDISVAPVPAARETPRAPGIHERNAPVVPPYQQARPEEPAVDTAAIKQRLGAIDSRLAAIDSTLTDYEKKKVEYDKVRLRIEVLFQKGIAAAKNVNGDPAKWFQYLPQQEKEWAQLNTLKKNKLEKELADLDVRMAPVVAEKNSLLDEKKDLERQLREAESPF